MAPVHQMPSTGAPFAHERSKTSGPSGHGVGGSNQRAPDGALAEKNRSAREPQFEQLCRMWVKPDGVNRAKALRAFSTVCAEHNGDDVLASAGAWVARVKAVTCPSWSCGWKTVRGKTSRPTGALTASISEAPPRWQWAWRR